MILAVLMKDFYKADHKSQYPEGSEVVYSNLTARNSRIPGIKEVLFFGAQYFVKDYLMRRFSDGFFKLSRAEAVKKYQRRMDTSLGPDAINSDHIGELHDLGYLPLEIKAMPEGTLVPLRVPLLTIKNTLPNFFWLTNFVETLLSNVIWHPITSATIAFEYRKMLEEYAGETSDMGDFVKWQGHDFSMRGQSSFESALCSGGAHLLSFTGTDTIPSIDWLEHFYKADAEKELIGGSVPATEHSVMCMGGQETEYDTYKRLITKVYPKGIVSIVSDTWDFWKVIGETIPSLKSEIMAREGKVVIRPDSGDPFDIICGDERAIEGTIQYKGTVEALWDTFGGTTNKKGYKQLHPSIGVIYGDSITLEKCQQILKGLKDKGFASTNMVFGIGSYTYQYVTRDTFGFAVKATYGEIKGQKIELFKAPKPDVGHKHSAKGLLMVGKDLDGNITLKQSASWEEEGQSMLKTIFKDGVAQNEQSLAEIRDRVDSNFKRGE